MSASADGDADGRREQVINDTVATYEQYASSGYADRWAAVSPGMRIAIERRDRWIESAITPALDGVIVDMGCGDGALGVLLDEGGRRPQRLVGIDLLGARLDVARRRVPWGDFMEASADRVPLPDATASGVTAMTLFSSLTDFWFQVRVAQEIDRILRAGGRLVVYDMRYPSPRNPHVRPISIPRLRRLFPAWRIEGTTMTVLPPLARSPVAGGAFRYGLLERLPPLRSHLGVILTKPLGG